MKRRLTLICLLLLLAVSEAGEPYRPVIVAANFTHVVRHPYFAQDKQGTVWFFGEAAKEFLSFGRVSTEGSWEAGVNGAQPGIVMPARPTVGERFRLEYLANVAEDIGQIAALGEAMGVPFGAFTDCVRIREWSMLDHEMEGTVGLGWQIHENLTLEQGVVFKEGGGWELVFAWEWDFGGD